MLEGKIASRNSGTCFTIYNGNILIIDDIGLAMFNSEGNLIKRYDNNEIFDEELHKIYSGSQESKYGTNDLNGCFTVHNDYIYATAWWSRLARIHIDGNPSEWEKLLINASSFSILDNILIALTKDNQLIKYDLNEQYCFQNIVELDGEYNILDAVFNLGNKFLIHHSNTLYLLDAISMKMQVVVENCEGLDDIASNKHAVFLLTRGNGNIYKIPRTIFAKEVITDLNDYAYILDYNQVEEELEF